MKIKVKEIPGLLVEKKDLKMPSNKKFTRLSLGWNDAINAQGEKELTLNRERLYTLLNKLGCEYNPHKDLDTDFSGYVADAIIAKFPQIVEVVK